MVIVIIAVAGSGHHNSGVCVFEMSSMEAGIMSN